MVKWTPVNICPKQTNLDNILGFELTDILASVAVKDTYVMLNICFNTLRRTNQSIPHGYNRYILGFWFEVFEEKSFLDLYQSNLAAEFVILTDLDLSSFAHLERCRVINLFHYKWFLDNFIMADIDWANRRYKISSLSNRITEFRYFITAKLLDQADVYFTWNRLDIGADIQYILEPAGWSLRDTLLAETSSRLQEKINGEIIEKSPLDSLRATHHPAYSQSLVNCINETKDVSWIPGYGTAARPYLTEKTWKPLFNGNALIFSGQVGIKNRLEMMGFNFDYPWSNDYAEIEGDLERLEKILELINIISDLSRDELQNGIRRSVEHNRKIIQDGTVQRWIDERNSASLTHLEKIL